jgi:hypothetical protein
MKWTKEEIELHRSKPDGEIGQNKYDMYRNQVQVEKEQKRKKFWGGLFSCSFILLQIVFTIALLCAAVGGFQYFIMNIFY